MKKEIYKQRIQILREKMQKADLSAYMILTDDFHGSEYVGDYFKCREYMSGFDGSAGTLIVTADEAGLWTDGRYFIQAAEQLEGTGVELYKMGQTGVPTILQFLRKRFLGKTKKDGTFAFDGRTVNAAMAERMARFLPGVEFRGDVDLVGEIWEDRPAFPHDKVWELGEQYAGESRASKLQRIRQGILAQRCNMHLMAALDDIAWTYNIRGNDIDYNPVAVSYTLITENEAVLYIAEDAVDGKLRIALEKDGVVLKPYLAIYDDLASIDPAGKRILLDKSSINTRLISALPEEMKIISKENPAKLMKAVKNEREQENERQAHIKDGVAVTKLIYWLKNERPADVTELDVARKLEELRGLGEDYQGQSFGSIIAAGTHGAIVHYEPTAETNQKLEENTFVLMDVGAHYLQGTTDITRTVALGHLTEEQKQHYTAVLKGHLNIASAKFRRGVNGNNLDYLARSPLWELGLDYNHGTGHGVGYLLNVHEGPNAIRLKNASAAFEPGMITSNEPGVYLEGKYGIRTENLVLCVNSREEIPDLLEFETLTMAPYDMDAVVPEMLEPKQKAALMAYFEKVYETIGPLLDEKERDWLKKERDRALAM